ncbi:MAG: metallophosphoesterase [Anaerolineales bacterium]|nr:MAG: metallophosphoesterase [Anaerolineales bacterium]
MRGSIKITRRGFLKAVGATTLGLGISGLAGYGYVFYVEPRWLSIERIDVPIYGLPEAFDGFKIVCMSDFHLHPYTQIDFIERAISTANELAPDVVCLLGDYVFEGADSIYELAPVLAELESTYGVFAVLGNHDLWTDAAIVRSGLEAVGIRVLVNESVPLRLGGDNLILAGLDDGWSGEPDLSLALEGSPQGSPVIMMLHEPDFADHYARDGRVRLQLSGHTHGGQVRIPGLGGPFRPEYGRKYDDGLVEIEGMWLYTTRGIGVIGPPARFNCRPEITEITLQYMP